MSWSPPELGPIADKWLGALCCWVGFILKFTLDEVQSRPISSAYVHLPPPPPTPPLKTPHTQQHRHALLFHVF